MFIPSYIETHHTGKLAERIKKAYKILENCRLCPRECEVNRLEDEKNGRVVSTCRPAESRTTNRAVLAPVRIGIFVS